MKKINNTLSQDYWKNFTLDEQDIELIYNFLLEKENPQKVRNLTYLIVDQKITQERARLERMQTRAALYMPKETYAVGTQITFSAFEMKSGKVIDVREGENPEFSPFQVIKVEFEDGKIREFAAGIENHPLNAPILFDADDPNLNINYVLQQYGSIIDGRIQTQLREFDGFVSIAEEWFPESLLIDINPGQLNLAEAVLDISGDMPVSTNDIILQAGFQEKDHKLFAFSLNIALQQDARFDEVGPAGEVLWFLKSMEPDGVKQQPAYLVSQLPTNGDEENTEDLMQLFEGVLADEYDPSTRSEDDNKELTFALIYPHWRSGTLPLSNQLRDFFPTAIETELVRFNFIDGLTKKTFPGWVVRSKKYVYGLKEWYEAMELIPGSIIYIRKGQNPGEVIIRGEKKRPSREWIRLAKVNENGKLAFSMDMQSVKSGYSDRMVIALENLSALESLWLKSVNERTFEQTVRHIMRELMRLNPQGHVHAQELYAATNLLLRCPPRAILNLLNRSSWVSHQGDLYYRLNESSAEGTTE